MDTSPSACDMWTFGANVIGSSALITTGDTTGTVLWTLPYETTEEQIAALAPTFTMSPSANCNQPNNGVTAPTPPLSTTTPVHYIVTAQDGFTTKDYTVSVTVVAPPPGAIYFDTFSRSGDLVGSAPSFASGTMGGSNPAMWATTTGEWMMNGAGAVLTVNDSNFASLPFSPLSSTIYTLNWTWTQTAGHWWEVVLSPSGPFPWGTVGPNPINVNFNGIAGVNTLSTVITTDAEGGYSAVTTFNDATAAPVTGLTANITAVGFITQAGASGTTMKSMSLSVGGTPPAVTYAGWAGTYAGGGAPNEDANNDGVQNGIAYFMNATGVATNPGITGNTVTWTNGGNILSSEYGADKQFVVQTSPDLVSWADVPNDGSDTNLSNIAGSVSYTLPPGAVGGKLFVRLVVTPN